MSNPDRKKKVLKKAERNLCAHILHEESAGKIKSAAETVRVSQLSLFKGQREIARYENTENNEKLASNVLRHLENIERNIKEWETMGCNDIIKQYRSISS